MITPEERTALFNAVFNNPAGKEALEYLESIYDVRCDPGTPEKEYINTCRRSVIKQIRMFMKQQPTTKE